MSVATPSDMEEYVLSVWGKPSTLGASVSRYLDSVSAGMISPRGWNVDYVEAWRSRVAEAKAGRIEALKQAGQCIEAMGEAPPWLDMRSAVDVSDLPACGKIDVTVGGYGFRFGITLRGFSEWTPKEQADAVLLRIAQRLDALQNDVVAMRNNLGGAALAAWARSTSEAKFGAAEKSIGSEAGSVIVGPWGKA